MNQDQFKKDQDQDLSEQGWNKNKTQDQSQNQESQQFNEFKDENQKAAQNLFDKQHEQ